MTNTTPHPTHTGPSRQCRHLRRTKPRKAWDHGCTNALVKSPSISTKGIARESNPTPTPKEADTKPPPRNEDKFGIDFWHAVEFSRSGRTPTRRLSATRRGNPSSLDPHPRGVKPRPEPRCEPARGARTPSRVSTTPTPMRLFPGGLPGGTDHLSVSVPPCRATSRTLGRPPGGVKSKEDHAWTSRYAMA